MEVGRGTCLTDRPLSVLFLFLDYHSQAGSTSVLMHLHVLSTCSYIIQPIMEEYKKNEAYQGLAPPCMRPILLISRAPFAEADE